MEKMSVNGKDYEIFKLLGHGKGGYSYLATDGSRNISGRSQELFLITIRNKKISRNRLFLASSLFHWYNSGNKNVSADGIERQNKKTGGT